MKNKKWRYWLIYSSLDFDARVVKAPIEWTPQEGDPDWSGMYNGPYETAKEARDEGVFKAMDDASSYLSMARECRTGEILDVRLGIKSNE